jgi:hypothetical protein
MSLVVYYKSRKRESLKPLSQSSRLWGTWLTNLVDNPLSIKLCPLTVTPLTRFPKECFLLDCPGLGLR